MLSDLVRAYERLTEEINNKDSDGDFVYSSEYRAKRQVELDNLKIAMSQYRVSESGDIVELDGITIDPTKYDINPDGVVTAKAVVE